MRWYRVDNSNGEFIAQEADEPSSDDQKWNWQMFYWSDGGISCYCIVCADNEQQAILLAKAGWTEGYTGRDHVHA